ncbi:hypothetical protein V5F38_02560 [Xanthobacter sp. V0B-10]|uniref:hypothetical protein n=1 Tax=Xanthobacter albus TaxID=3119929 RepID=UPI00372C4639
MGPVIVRALAFICLPLKAVALKAALFATLAVGLLAGSLPARAQACLEQIVTVQQQLKAKFPPPKQPPAQAQSIGAQDAQQPTPGSLEAAGLTGPQTGAYGALNQAMNLQAAGDESGCFKALAEARRLGGLD